MKDTYVVSDDAAGRLDVWVAAVAHLTRAEARRRIERGLVTVDGEASHPAARVKTGQHISVVAEPDEDPDTAAQFAIRYQDDHLAVVYKPAGVVVHPAPGTKSGTLVEALAAVMPLAPAAGEQRPGIVHRLDKDTSGLIVVAKTDEAYRLLVEMIRARSIERRYVALVLGRFAMPTGRIEAPVGRVGPRRMGVTSSGRDAATTFRVTVEYLSCSLLEVRLQTGRTHQIRVHLSHIGHPVVGDPDYGNKASVLAKELGLQRPFLHASHIGFAHPITSERMEVTEPMPPDLVEALRLGAEAY